MQLARNHPRLRRTVFFCLFLVALLFLACRHYFKNENFIIKKPKLILAYTTLWGNTSPEWIKAFYTQHASNCPYSCKFSTDKSRLHEADAVIFHGRASDLAKAKSILLEPRPPELFDQIWIWMLNESPESYPDPGLLPYENIFNWTMTYRQDSDVPAPGGKLTPLSSNEQLEWRKPESVPSKKLVSAMISNRDPKSKRLDYISSMQKYIPVDVYGAAGNFTCSKKKNCYEIFGTQYKFFLAFENSICADYVTEKFYKPLRYGLVPVVRGGANYSQLFPPGSYIDTRDFRTVEDLAQYLKHLDTSDDEYLKYFDWKKVYAIDADVDLKTRAQCSLCTKLHHQNPTLHRKSYKSILSWHRTNYTDTYLCTAPSTP